MQATVLEFDPATYHGAVVLDDGVRLTFTADALAGSRLRLLRRGQRVTVVVEDDRVTSLQILTLHA